MRYHRMQRMAIDSLYMTITQALLWLLVWMLNRMAGRDGLPQAEWLCAAMTLFCLVLLGTSCATLAAIYWRCWYDFQKQCRMDERCCRKAMAVLKADRAQTQQFLSHDVRVRLETMREKQRAKEDARNSACVEPK